MPNVLKILSYVLVVSVMSSCTSQLIVLSPSAQCRQIAENPSNKALKQTLCSAAKEQDANPRASLAKYLYALEVLGSDSAQDTEHEQSYQMALSHAVELAQQHQLWSQALSYNGKAYQITLNNQKSDTLKFDQLEPATKYQCKAFTPKIETKGNGVAMVAHYPWNEERDSKDPFLPHIGYCYPIVASGQWRTNATLSVSLTHPDTDSASDFSAPFCLIQQKTRNLERQGVRNVFRPNNTSWTGLFSNESLNPNKIPLILVHGLASSPNIWLDPQHQFLQNPEIRLNYQPFVYYYSTGLPIAYNAAILKKSIQHLEQRLKQQGAGSNTKQMVLAGHSMGGVISSMLTRDLTGTMDSFLSTSPEQIDMNQRAKMALLTLFDEEPLDCISRAIFIAAPHRGSKMANNWYGQLASNLIQIPNSIVRPSSDDYLQNLSELGRNIIPSADDLDGIKRLEYKNAALMYILSRPKVPQVTYHSVIGNRGRKGDLAQSSDGVVPYSSSHLENAVSECIVPSGHSAQNHPQTIEEIQRILLLNLH